MVGVDLRDDHRDVALPAVGGIVGDHGDLRLRVTLLEGEDLFFFHIDGAEDEIGDLSDLLHLGGVENGHGTHGLGDRGLHLPAAPDGFFVGPSGGTGGRGDAGHFKIRVVFEQGQKALAHHAGRADDDALQFFSHDNASAERCSGSLRQLRRDLMFKRIRGRSGTVRSMFIIAWNAGSVNFRMHKMSSFRAIKIWRICTKFDPAAILCAKAARFSPASRSFLTFFPQEPCFLPGNMLQ